jgi:hypothetical protein
LPAARLALPRGAAPHRGQARGDGAGRPPIGSGDPGQRPHGVSGDARPGARRHRQSLRSGSRAGWSPA